MEKPKTIVVVGGTGNFGARICRRLAREAECRLVICSRHLQSAEALASELRLARANAQIEAAKLDHSHTDFESALAALTPDITIHTAGPFQGQDYRVAEACLHCASHYIDLADGRDFVAGFSRLHDAAQQRDLLMVSGASTLPGLSSAVVKALADEFATVSDIEISIAPAGHTPRGPGTVAAVLSYCGKPFSVFEQGRWVTRHGWQDLRVQHYPAVGRRLSGACDVPDLALLLDYTDGTGSVTFHAALEAWWEHLALWLMAWLARAGLVGDWSKFADRFAGISKRLARFGSDTGGMQVIVKGASKDGRAMTRSWFLTAGNNHGPEIPCSPALVLARRLLRGDSMGYGAFACLGLVTIGEFAKEVSEFDIHWKVQEQE